LWIGSKDLYIDSDPSHRVSPDSRPDVDRET
jgi:hypothetical protein